ncbi:MAG: FeoA domain-containing protein [Candidatus Bathyarchaeota archaeon]|nr:FeoA domain-containing protein [Candidatus Bathyarchaeota archaeon]
MTKESGILKIVKEDILRILAERKGKVSLDIIKEEINVFYSFVSEAIKKLEKEGLIQSQQGFFELTERGGKKAKDILRKYLVLENYFKRIRTEKEAHEIGHILEHYVSKEVFNNIKKLSTFKGKGIPLTKLKLHKEGLITDIMISDNELFERIVSMGIFPGEKIVITNEVPNSIIVKIKNKKFALDKHIAKEIKVLEYGKS